MHPLVPRSNFSGTMPGLFIELPRETVRKGFRIAARASILAPHSSEIGLFRPFRGLLRLQFGARGDFSDSLRRGILGNSEHKREPGLLDLGSLYALFRLKAYENRDSHKLLALPALVARHP